MGTQLRARLGALQDDQGERDLEGEGLRAERDGLATEREALAERADRAERTVRQLSTELEEVRLDTDSLRGT